MGIFLVWIVLSVVIGIIGGNRKIGFGGALILSLLLSPLIGLIVTLASQSKLSMESDAKLITEQQRTNELLQQSKINSVTQELQNLQQMRTNGTLNEDEYEKLRTRIIEGKS